MLVWIDGVIAEEDVLHELRRVADHLRTAERRWRANHAEKAIPRLSDAIVGHSSWNQLKVFVG